MNEKYNINEILDAIKELNKRNTKNFTRKQNKNFDVNKKDNSEIPENTLKLIEEAEKKLN
tara:strand:+ start:1630 stop:1809 length:180 start_codon:yes stop_codon:yes gene_type:complete